MKDIFASQAVEEAQRTIALARVRCLPFARLIERLRQLLTDDQPSEIVYAVIEAPRNDEQNHELATALRHLLTEADQAPARRREWLDRQIRRILLTLPSKLAQPIARECLKHRRKSMRTAGFRSLSLDTIDDETSLFFIGRFDETGDERFLKELLQKPLRLNCVDPDKVADAFEGDDYWVMRVVEATLRGDRLTGVRLGERFPKSFVWASGRLGDSSLVSYVSRIFEATNDKNNLLGIVAWAYGKLRASEKLEALVPIFDDFSRDSLKD